MGEESLETLSFEKKKIHKAFCKQSTPKKLGKILAEDIIFFNPCSEKKRLDISRELSALLYPKNMFETSVLFEIFFCICYGNKGRNFNSAD